MKDVIVVVNHVQDSYLDRNNPVDAALREKIFDFVDEIRPLVKGIAWSYATGMNARNIPFDLERERSSAYRAGDIDLINNDGKGLDSGFLQKLNKANPGGVILAGVYYDACSEGTATNIRQGLGVPVAVPKDLADAPDPGFSYHHDSATQRMASVGIDVKSTAKDLVAAAMDFPYAGPAVTAVQQSPAAPAATSIFRQPAAPKT